MIKLQDHYCRNCQTIFEFLQMGDERPSCTFCDSEDTELRLNGGHVFHVITPSYKGSKKYKAGFVHSHGDRPAEKGSVSVPSNFKGDA